MDGISLESLRQKSSKGFEFAVKKRRNQSLLVGSTVISKVLTPLMGFLEGEDLRSKRFKKPRLTVPFERRELFVAKERMDRRKRTFHGSFGDNIVSNFLDMFVCM
ncbi:hypothetical protein FCV25MIE_03187 [Fagus crenata]